MHAGNASFNAKCRTQMRCHPPIGIVAVPQSDIHTRDTGVFVSPANGKLVASLELCVALHYIVPGVAQSVFCDDDQNVAPGRIWPGCHIRWLESDGYFVTSFESLAPFVQLLIQPQSHLRIMMMTSINLTAAIGTIVAAIFANVIWKLFLSPLRTFPGPFLAKFTDAWRAYLATTGAFDKHQINWHRQWGSAVRIGPKTISLSDPDLIKVVYASKNAWRKVSTPNQRLKPVRALLIKSAERHVSAKRHRPQRPANLQHVQHAGQGIPR